MCYSFNKIPVFHLLPSTSSLYTYDESAAAELPHPYILSLCLSLFKIYVILSTLPYLSGISPQLLTRLHLHLLLENPTF